MAGFALGEQELFRQLEEEHAKFHHHAAKVVEAYQAGDTELAEKLLAGTLPSNPARP